MVLVKHGNRTCCSWFGVVVILVIVVIRLVIGSKTREGMLFGITMEIIGVCNDWDNYRYWDCEYDVKLIVVVWLHICE